MVSKVRKRDGRVVDFDPGKIARAIEKAMVAVGERDWREAERLAGVVVNGLAARFDSVTPGVEDIQDVVEKTLMQEGFDRVAKAYILYRQKRAEVRGAKRAFDVEDELKLTVNAVKVLRTRYLLKDEEGSVVETPAQMFRRVAKAVATAEAVYGKDPKVMEEHFYRILSNLEFLPNSPTLMNAGTDIGQLSACFVLPVPDSIEGIFDALKYMAMIHKSGGGTGFSFSQLRPRGDVVGSTKGVASGPISFMRIFDMATEVIKQGGRRRGANMGILRIDHPDVLEFITCKAKEGFLLNFNISVTVTDAFMKAVEEGREYDLINPRTGKAVQRVAARDVFDLIVANAWLTGDPGMVFIDEINRHNPTPEVGSIESTNPCGEQPLLPYESCNLGSVNLTRMFKDGEIDWDRLREVVRLGVHFLDNGIDVNKFPLKEIEDATKANRKIGIGVMGFAELLIRLGIPYDSEEALAKAEEVMRFVSEAAVDRSVEMAGERGSFPNFGRSIWKKKGSKARRNSTLTTVAPTGTISIIAGCVSGIEPLFAISYIRSILEGAQLLEVNSLFEDVARRRGFYSRELMMEIAKRGSVRGMEQVPEDVQRVFVTALDIAPEWHVRMQAAFQKYTENAVSKTVNLPQNATLEDVRDAYLMAHRLRCKGTTVYRYGSKPQVLYIGSVEKEAEVEHVRVDSEYSGGCPGVVCTF